MGCCCATTSTRNEPVDDDAPPSYYDEGQSGDIDGPAGRPQGGVLVGEGGIRPVRVEFQEGSVLRRKFNTVYTQFLDPNAPAELAAPPPAPPPSRYVPGVDPLANLPAFPDEQSSRFSSH